MATHHPIRKVVAAPVPVIPDKLYFRIGDVARLCQVPAYVLRFWETEFPNLKPNKGGTGQRLYRRKEVEIALRIKHLLYDLGYTIPGARQVFKTDAKPANELSSNAVILSAARSAESKDPDAAQAATNLSTFPTPAPDRARLQALREELRAIHAQLSAPIADPAAPKQMRPRLVLEPRPKAELKPEPKPVAIVLPGQQALFPAE
jgi:DNA-binding transcriptional MerR regulator